MLASRGLHRLMPHLSRIRHGASNAWSHRLDRRSADPGRARCAGPGLTPFSRSSPRLRAGREGAADRHAHRLGGRCSRQSFCHREPYPLPAQGLRGAPRGPHPSLRGRGRRRPLRTREHVLRGNQADDESGVRARWQSFRRHPKVALSAGGSRRRRQVRRRLREPVTDADCLPGHTGRLSSQRTLGLRFRLRRQRLFRAR